MVFFLISAIFPYLVLLKISDIAISNFSVNFIDISQKVKIDNFSLRLSIFLFCSTLFSLIYYWSKLNEWLSPINLIRRLEKKTEKEIKKINKKRNSSEILLPPSIITLDNILMTCINKRVYETFRTGFSILYYLMADIYCFPSGQLFNFQLKEETSSAQKVGFYLLADASEIEQKQNVRLHQKIKMEMQNKIDEIYAEINENTRCRIMIIQASVDASYIALNRKNVVGVQYLVDQILTMLTKEFPPEIKFKMHNIMIDSIRDILIQIFFIQKDFIKSFLQDYFDKIGREISGWEDEIISRFFVSTWIIGGIMFKQKAFNEMLPIVELLTRFDEDIRTSTFEESCRVAKDEFFDYEYDIKGFRQAVETADEVGIDDFKQGIKQKSI